jgi:SAM-dependent methyltransferase
VGKTVLTVCGGSGMDAEFLARHGASVISSDISFGAARRARERAGRHRLPITPIVADVERLPFADQAVDIVYVHDGLHHIEQPLEALREMARVARFAVSINEPARAAVTSLAVRLGFALEFEDAGNRVQRLSPDTVAAELELQGFVVTAVGRYGMYFKHQPGRLMMALSRPLILPFVKLFVQLFNALAGRYGNKLTVQAVRAANPLAAGQAG